MSNKTKVYHCNHDSISFNHTVEVWYCEKCGKEFTQPPSNTEEYFDDEYRDQ